MKTAATGWLVVMVVREDYWNVWNCGTSETLERLERNPQKGVPAFQAVPKPWNGLSPWGPWLFDTPFQRSRITNNPIKPVVWVCRQKWPQALGALA